MAASSSKVLAQSSNTHRRARSLFNWFPGLSLLLGLWTTPALAAEQVSVSFGSLLNLNIPVSDLETFAKTGQLSGELSTYSRLAPPNALNNLRDILQQSFQLSSVTVAQFARSTTGKLVFEAMGKFFRTQDNQNGQTALAIAFEKAAANPKGLTILDVIRQFPDATMNIDGQISFAAVRAVGQKLRDRAAIFAEIEKLAEASAAKPGTPQTDLTQPGPVKWKLQTLNVSAQSLGVTQPVPVDYYLPQGLQAPAPVIVIASGFASNRSTFAYLAQHLASHGFAVIIPTFPYTDTAWISGFLGGNSSDQVDIPRAMLSRPKGITLLLDDLQQKVQSDANWKKLVNPQQVGLLGQSLGGYTVLASAGATVDFPGIQRQCSRDNFSTIVLSFNLSLLFECQLVNAPTTTSNFVDPRVKAVISINPLTSVVFGQPGMSQIKVPTMLISGGDDIFAPPVQGQIYPFTWLTTPDKYLFFLRGGTHFSFLADSPSEQGVPVPADLIGPDPKLARPSLKALSTAFFFRHVTNQPQYQSYLTQSYAQTVVPQPFGVNFIQSLTAEQLQRAIAAAAPKQ